MSRQNNDEPFHIKDCVVKHVTDKGILVESEELPEGKDWFPKSQVHEASDLDPYTVSKGDEGTLAIKWWLAVEKELVDEEAPDTFDHWSS